MTRPAEPQDAVDATADDQVVEPHSLVRNSVFLIGARVYTVLASAVVSVVTIRVFSVTEYGEFAVALAVVQLMTSLSELGIATLGTRRLVERDEPPDQVLGTMLAAEIGGSLLFAALLLPAALLLGYSTSVLVIMALGAGLVFTVGIQAALSGAFQARRVNTYTALVTAIQSTILLALGLSVLAAGGKGAGLIVAMTIAESVAVAVSVFLVRRRLHMSPQLRGVVRRVPEFLRAAAPIAASTGIAVLYARLDLLMLSKLDGVRAAAIYNVPLMIVEVSYVVPAAITVAFFPLLAQQLIDDPDDATRSLSLLFRLFLLGAGALAWILVLAGGDMIELVFGNAYAASGPVLAIMAGVIVVNALNYLVTYALLAVHQEKRRWRVQLVGLVLNGGLNLLLIPAHGAKGAAIALLVADLLVLGAFVVVASRTVLATSLPSLFGAPLALAGALALAAVLLAGHAAAVPLAAAISSAWVVGLFVLRYLAVAELEPLLGPARAIAGGLPGLRRR